jgi:hypothetical protein
MQNRAHPEQSRGINYPTNDFRARPENPHLMNRLSDIRESELKLPDTPRKESIILLVSANSGLRLRFALARLRHFTEKLADADHNDRLGEKRNRPPVGALRHLIKEAAHRDGLRRGRNVTSQRRKAPVKFAAILMAPSAA